MNISREKIDPDLKEYLCVRQTYNGRGTDGIAAWKKRIRFMILYLFTELRIKLAI
jgi:hypothetical protein